MGKDWEANDAEDDDKLCSSVLLGKAPQRAEGRKLDIGITCCFALQPTRICCSLSTFWQLILGFEAQEALR